MKAIRYLRYSKDGQSQHSIERQDIVTATWIASHKIQVLDTFIDEGETARNFDRPDLKELLAFIKRNKGISYLVVAELTRFSRSAGDAINLVSEIQRKYNIRIVSAARSAVYDVFDSNSFLMMGLEFLMGNSENIKRTNDTNGGIYAAKAVKGKWIQGGKNGPYGYSKGPDGTLIKNEAEASIVKFIYQSFLNRMPVYRIAEEARSMGFRLKGNDVIQKIIRNPLYMGYQHVKAWKELPGGLFPLKNFEPVISVAEWNEAQEVFTNPKKQRVIVHEQFPLRGVVHCGICNKPITGAPSRGRSGRLYDYYKCNTSKHLNISANTMHTQLQAILQHLNLPKRIIDAIRSKSEVLLKERLSDRSKQLMLKRTELNRVQSNIESLEEKWLTGQATLETYNRWFHQYSDQRLKLAGEVEALQKDFQITEDMLHANLDQLQHLDSIYEKATVEQKQELIRKVFDNSLRYQNKAYRTTYIMPLFAHNLLVLKQKHLLDVDALLTRALSREAEKPPIEPILEFITFLSSIKAA